MPFNLKNVGATYQRLVNKMFSEQLEKMVEVYINDMLLVKSLKDTDHVAHQMHLQSNIGEILRILGNSKGNRSQPRTYRHSTTNAFTTNLKRSA